MSEDTRPSPVEFRWDAPEQGCPREAVVRAELERLVGRPLHELEAGRLTVIARVRRDPDGTWDLRLWTVTPEQTRFRNIRDASCELVSDAAALIAAMIVDPRGAEREVDADVQTKADEAEAAAVDVDEPEPAPAPAPEPEPAPASGSEPARPPEPAAPARDGRLRTSLGAFGGAAFDGRPSIGPNVAVAVGIGAGAGFGEVELHLGPPIRTELAGAGPDAAFVVTDLHAALRGCYDLRRHPRVAFTACGGLELGALLGRGENLAQSRVDAVPWVAIGLRPALGVRLWSRLWLEINPELVVPLARTSFEVSGLGVVHEPRAVGGRGMLGLRWWWGEKVWAR